MDNLYEEIVVEGDSVGIIHIYSEYPDYKWVDDDDEGTACVDDAARAEIFYLQNYINTGNKESLHKAQMLLKFILALQADNGYFYNFVWSDGSINKTFKTSVAIGNWWSWRALWALSESYARMKEYDPAFAKRILSSIELVVENIKRDFKKPFETTIIDGYERPTWLPYGSASDQASVIVLGLLNVYNITQDEEIQEILIKLCDGILLMQTGDENTLPYYAILSWENIWHAWGSSQSYALLIAGEFFERQDYIDAALREITHFYDFLLEQGYYADIKLHRNSDPELIKYAQIAYGIRPMIYACLTAERLQNDDKYGEKASQIMKWFYGNNPAKQQMYFPGTGICFDGIISKNEVNRNSGAESTIECLLSLQAYNTYLNNRINNQ